MQDFFRNIDNKEIFIEILHHSVDYLIGNQDDESTYKLCHKYGYQDPDKFLVTTKAVMRAIQNSCCEGGTENDILSEFSNINPELQSLVLNVLAARKQEIYSFLVRRSNAQVHPLVESFDWDIRLIMGDSSLEKNYRHLATLTFNCSDAVARSKTMHFEMGRQRLNEFIEEIEKAINHSAVILD